MDPLALVLHCAGSPSSKPAGASTDGAVQQAPAPSVAVESRPGVPIPVSGGVSSLVTSDPEVPSHVLGKEIVVHVGESSSSFRDGHDKGKAVVVADAEGTIQTVEEVDASGSRFVLIHDVKAMLHTGRFEGQQITYKNKRRKLNLLHGVIHGTYYFCTCGGHCDQNGKALSARRFEQHAVMKGGKMSNNPNNHIILSSSNISMFEACQKLKEARNEATVHATIDSIVKCDHEAMHNQNVKTPADSVHNLEKRMERCEKMIEQVQSRMNTMEKNIDSLCQEMRRHKALFQDLSKVMGKFADDI